MAERHILIVDDERKLVKLLTEALESPGRRISGAGSATDAWGIITGEKVDLVISDLRMESDEAGLELLARLRKGYPAIKFILITAFASIEAGVRALELGAAEYMVKPIRMRSLRETVDALLDRLDTDLGVEPPDELPHTFDDILVGTHTGMRRIYELLPRIVASDSNVLVIGESGTGKEVIARAVHKHGARAARPFIQVNCAALVDSLLESELFGIEKGVATDVGARPGKFEQAAGGTIFLDEIGDMALSTQAKVLRVLQERRFERVGGSKTIEVDVRVVAATHRDLEEMASAGTFRQDLFYRLNVIRLELPPLRERLGDLDLYIQYFLRKLAPKTGHRARGVSGEVKRILTEYSWPGNIRELENVIERALVLSTGEVLERSDLPPLIRRGLAGDGALLRLPEEGLSLDDLERDLLRQAMERSNGNKSAAARLLGLTRRTLGYRLEKHGLGGSDPD